MTETKIAEKKAARIVKRCEACGWRLCDKVTPASGHIEIKCPRCGASNVINLALRRSSRHEWTRWDG